MSGSQNAFSVQAPLFAPMSQAAGGQLTDDIDLNDMFAEYFSNEFEDPVAMAAAAASARADAASFNAAAAAMALAQQQQVQQQQAHQQQAAALASSLPPPPQDQGDASSSSSLPTGRGIKTAWHSGALPSVAAGGGVVLSYGPGGAVVASSDPASKRVKTEHMQHQQAQVAAPFPPHAMQPAPTSNGSAASAMAAAGSGGISARLGYSVVGGQLVRSANGAQPQQQQQQQQLQSSMPHPGVPSASTNGVSLPVGVGIRVGGAGGAVQAAAGAPGGVPVTSVQWGTAAGGVAHVQHGPGTAGGPSPTPLTMNYPSWMAPPGGGGLTEQAIAERRQRNREHAKRSRVRKKFMLESLQEEVRGLQRENVNLRMLIQEKIPQHAQKIIDECCSKNPLFEEGDFGGSRSDSKEVKLMRSDFSLIESLTSGQQNFVLSDPRLPDNPIVFASPGFFELTGYTREQVLGRNCRFLQGPGTDPKAVDVIRTAIANGTDATTCLLNYKADGTPFWNQFFVAALRDADNNIVNYVGVQTAINPEAGATALEDKVNSVMPLQEKGAEEEND